MTIKEFYNSIQGDYEEVTSRLMNDILIKKFLLKFENDKSFENLKQAISENDAKNAFIAAHTLKGVTISLGLGELNTVSSEITELLRNADVANTKEIKTLMDSVEKCYNKVLVLIKETD